MTLQLLTIHDVTDELAGELTVDCTVVDPVRAPEVAGPCTYSGCGCPAFVKDYYGDCASCTHPANAHY